jgi:magnesium chelatase family protein
VDAFPVEVEVDISGGVPQLRTVGLAEGAVREAQERVKAAIKNSGYEFPNRKITINLAPADTRKEGSSFDLPIALAILAASTGALSAERIRNYLIQGELALDGRIKGIRGALPSALLARSKHYAGIILPRENAAEASVASNGTAVLGVETLRDTVDFLEGCARSSRTPPTSASCSPPPASTTSTSAKCAARGRPSARSKWPPPAATTS